MSTHPATAARRARLTDGAQRPSASVRRDTRLWKVAALFTFFPVTAVLHHRVFVRPHCMTNLLSTGKTSMDWIRSDPSPWLGLLAAAVALLVVSRRSRMRFWVAAIPLAFFPLSLWLWDIPGTSIICPLFHDGKAGIRSWHLYLLGAALYLPMVALLMRGTPFPSRLPAIPADRLPARRRPARAWYPGQPGAGEIPPPRPNLPGP